MSLQFWPIIAVLHVSVRCEFGRTVGVNEPEEPCPALAEGEGDLVGLTEEGQPEEIHLHLCARHYEMLQSGVSSVWVMSR